LVSVSFGTVLRTRSYVSLVTTRDDSKGEEPPCCKLGRAIERYGLGGLDEELTQRWRGAGGERSGVRDLADRVNVGSSREPSKSPVSCLSTQIRSTSTTG
jgi:hypothetical protein